MNQTREDKFTITAAAQLLSVSPTTVRREIKRRNLGSYLLAGRRLIGESHLTEYLARCERKPQLD
jgi:excisionase family DNA binding protein